VNWIHCSGCTRFRDLVRFQWKSGTNNWSTCPPAFKIMPKVGSLQTVQAKLDPTGTCLVYRINGSGQDRYERLRVVDVENNVNRTFGKAGPFPVTRAKATAPLGVNTHIHPRTWAGVLPCPSSLRRVVSSAASRAGSFLVVLAPRRYTFASRLGMKQNSTAE
jgi:hypothetical protein